MEAALDGTNFGAAEAAGRRRLILRARSDANSSVNTNQRIKERERKFAPSVRLLAGKREEKEKEKIANLDKIFCAYLFVVFMPPLFR